MAAIEALGFLPVKQLIATVTTPPAAVPDVSLLFEDLFAGAANAVPDVTKWIQHAENGAEFASYSPIKNANAFLDGSGHLVMRVKRDTAVGGSGPYSGSWIGTFNYGNGWPPSNIKASWPVPYRIETSAKLPKTAGAWCAAWNMNVDRATSSSIYELDWLEERMTLPTSFGCHQHRWLLGVDQDPWDGGLTVTDMADNYHTYRVDALVASTKYYIDGVLVGTAPATTGTHGLLLDNVIATPGSWGAAGGAPSAGDPGPWDMLLDYVRVTSLA